MKHTLRSCWMLLLAIAACSDPPPSSLTLLVPPSVQAAPGTSTFIELTMEQTSSSPVTLSVEVPPGFQASVSPEDATERARLRVWVPHGTPAAKYSLGLTGTSAEGIKADASIELEVLPPLQSPAKPVELSVRLDSLFYANGQSAKVTVDFGSLTPPATVPDIVLVSAESHDVERVALTRIGGNRFESSPIAVTASEAPGAALDGAFTLPGGGLFFALFPIDRGQPGFETFPADHVDDFAFLDGERPGMPSSRVEPALAFSPDERAPVPGARPFGTLVRVGGGQGSGLPVQLATQELIFFHRDSAELDRFVTASQGQVLETQPVEGELPLATLVQVDPAKVSPARLALMRGFLEDGGELVASRPEVQGIYGLAMAFRLEGFVVAVNPRLSYQSPPAVGEPERTELLPSMRMRGRAGSSTPCIPGVDSRRCATNVPALWTYLDLLELDQQRVKAAVLDMGFAPNPDFRTHPDGTIEQCDVTGRSLRCGPGLAVGPPTVGGSLVGERVWHGTGVVTTLGGRVDNGFGGAGTGGQVVIPMLYKYDLASYAFDMGRGMSDAVNRGAQVVNVSAGYPCTAVTQVGPDFDYCSVEGRVGICAVVTAAAHAAAVAFCTSPAAGIPIVGQAVCGGLAGAAVVATNACLATLSLGNVRAPMQSAVVLATSRGVPVVASAGNRLPPEEFPAEVRSLLDLSEARAERWGIVPATLPNVVAVGAASEADLGNEHCFGDRVDVWAPIPSLFYKPMNIDDPASLPTAGSIGGTSAAAPYVAGVIAAMQAANRSLDPARATAAERGTAVSRVRSILTSTALTNAELTALGWANDPIERRNLIDPLRAVLEAARGAQPDLAALGYDTSLNFSEADLPDDIEASARPIPFDAQVTGTIFAFDSSPQDMDWKSFTVPTATGRVFGSNVVVQWVGDEAPTLHASGAAFPRISESTAGVEKSATYRVVRNSGEAVRFAVTAPAGADAVYKVTVPTPTALSPTVTITEPVLASGQTLCANSPSSFRATASYPPSTLTTNAIEWLLNGVLQSATGPAVTFTRPAGTDTFTARSFGATATLTVTFVPCTAVAEILQPTGNVAQYASLSDATGPYLQLNFSGRAVDGSGTVINPATLVFEWTTDRGDLQPGAPSTGSQLLGTGPSLSNVRIYGKTSSTGEVHVITLTVRSSAGGPVLSTDSIQVTVQNLI